MTDVHEANDASAKRRRSRRSLTAEEKLQIWLELLSGECSQRDAAQRWGVDPTTIMRIRRVARAGALSALAQSRPGVRAGAEEAEIAALRAEVARLEEAVKEQAIELVALRGKTALLLFPWVR
jgi:transposase-like protein